MRPSLVLPFAATLPLIAWEDCPTLPRAAVLYDLHGGAWVYERTGPQAYVRRRIDVRAEPGDLAVLARGPAAGAQVVTAGAAELFGTEFGIGK